MSENSKYKLRNYMEVSVMHALPSVLKSFPYACDCERCQMDIIAYALNHLQPKYVITDKGELFLKVNELRIQYEADIFKALIDAINVVSESPRHNN